MAKKKSTSFETILNELEQIVKHLESDSLPLNEALTQFETGIGLIRQGQHQLLEAEQRVQILLSDEDNHTTLIPFKAEE